MRTLPLLGAVLLGAVALASANPASAKHRAVEALAADSDGDVGLSISINERKRHRTSVALGIHLSNYPDLVVIPGMPVLYDPHLMANYFFYDGSFWVFEDDDWYRSDWYNGPWMWVDRNEVPVFLLRVPVRYYNRAPLYFRPWAREMAPRWSLRWGNEWERRHRNWDRWDHKSAPPPAPPPVFQRQFPRERYPSTPEAQQRLRQHHYPYRPREPVNPPPLQPRPVRPPAPQAPDAQQDSPAAPGHPAWRTPAPGSNTPPGPLGPAVGGQPRERERQQALQREQATEEELKRAQEQKQEQREEHERERRERPPGSPPRA